jgi:ribosomal protein S11
MKKKNKKKFSKLKKLYKKRKQISSYKNLPRWLKNKKINKFRKIFRRRSFYVMGLFFRLFKFKFKQRLKKKILIAIKRNNVFCTLYDISSKKILRVFSAGKAKIKISRKSLKYYSKILIEKYLFLLKKRIKKNDTLFISVSGRKKLRKFTVKKLLLIFKKNKFILEIKPKKCFNGCRPKKTRRKKRKGLRIFK